MKSKAKIIQSKFFHIQPGEEGEVEQQTKHGAAIKFKKVFEPNKKITTRTYWFANKEYKLV